MTDEELKALVAGLAVSQAETDRQLQETGQLIRELRDDNKVTDRQMEETDRRLQEISADADRRRRQAEEEMRQLRRDIGGLGNKFGGFTEGLAYPSMQKLLSERFRMEFIAPRVRKRKNGREFEADVLAYSNTESNTVFLVEVKSRLDPDGIDQILRHLEVFFDFFPEHQDKDLYGILAVVDGPQELRARVLNNGVYLAQISGDVFELQVPEDFEPRSFALTGVVS